MKMPASFKISLKNKETKEKNERLKELKEENKYKQLCEKHFQQEKTLSKSKIEICKKIFAWKEEFLKTKEGMTIFKKAHKNLWVFNGSWAHKLPRYGKYGCWARLYFNPKSITYWAGYKWTNYQIGFEFTQPADMAKKLDYKYIREFLIEIENKKIFKNILELL